MPTPVRNEQTAEPDWTCAPILLIAFNRPNLLSGLIETIRPAAPARVYLAVDGPRADHPEDAEACAACAALASRIDWPCMVEVCAQPVNLGCRKGVAAALRWFFSHVESGIILEDDIVPSMDFLRFASEMLVRYADDPRVGMITGNNFYGFQTDRTASYHFSAFVSIWGWAAWKRLLDAYEDDPEAYRDDAEALIAKSALSRQGRWEWTQVFRQVLQKRATWDIQLQLTLFRKGFLVVCPRVNLCGNRGWLSEKAVHTGGYSCDIARFSSVQSLPFPLVHPEVIARDCAADRKLERRKSGLLPRILTALGNRFAGLRSLIGFCFPRIERLCPALFRL